MLGIVYSEELGRGFVAATFAPDFGSAPKRQVSCNTPSPHCAAISRTHISAVPKSLSVVCLHSRELRARLAREARPVWAGCPGTTKASMQIVVVRLIPLTAYMEVIEMYVVLTLFGVDADWTVGRSGSFRGTKSWGSKSVT